MTDRLTDDPLAPAVGAPPHPATHGSTHQPPHPSANGGRAHSAYTAPERRQRQVGTRRAIRSIKAEHAANRTLMERAADGLTRAAASGGFLAVHALWFAGWIAWNVGALGQRPFDPYPFGLLTMIVSLEAIFLTIFVLMSQARESAVAELREELTLQVNLRVEEEVTKTLQLVAGLYTRLGYRVSGDAELDEMLRPLDAAEIERDLTEQIREGSVSLGERWRKVLARKPE